MTKIEQRLQEIRARGPMHREADVLGVDIEARAVQLSFSSEAAEVPRWFGLEVLSHGPGAANLDRLNDNAAVLWNHNFDDMRGKVEPGSATIDSDRRGRATIRLSRSAEGEKLLQDIADGIVTKVSVGYVVHGMRFVEDRGDTEVYLVTDWEPIEISLVSVPADYSVGVGRTLKNLQVDGAGDDVQTTQKTNSSPELRKAKIMGEQVKRDASGNLVRAKVDDAGNIVEVLELLEKAGAAEASAQQRGLDGERRRVQDLTALGQAYGCAERAMQFIADGKTSEDLRRDLLDDFARERGKKPLDEQVKKADIGMTDKEVRGYSLMRAIRALADRNNAKIQKDAAFELECSRAAAEAYGKSPEGLIIPNDVLGRTFATTSPAAGPGSNIVATNLLAGSFIELLRHKAWVMRRARTLGGLVGNVDIPRQNAAGQAYWVGEGGAPDTTQPGVDQIRFTPKTVGATTDITRRLMMQSTPDAEALVRDDLLKIVALEIDRVAIYGTGGDNQPLGVNNIKGIKPQAFAKAEQPTFAELVAMETQIALDDADVDTMSYSFNAGLRGYAKTALKFPNTASGATIWEPGKTVNGYETNVSNQIQPGDVFFGNWNDLVVAMWGGLELTVDPYALSTSGGLRLVVLQDIDINVRHVESFCYGSGSASGGASSLSGSGSKAS